MLSLTAAIAKDVIEVLDSSPHFGRGDNYLVFQQDNYYLFFLQDFCFYVEQKPASRGLFLLKLQLSASLQTLRDN